MLKRLSIFFLAAFLVLAMAACSNQSPPSASQDSSTEPSSPPPVVSDDTDAGSQPEENGGEETGSRILIAYFTRLDNTEATLEEILQGGGPYGPIGNSLEDADVDAIASASITPVDGEAQGNVETLAQMIQANTGGELFSIQTEESYPVDYDTLIDQGGDENAEEARPSLATHVDNLEDYDIIFLGFPNWWYDMPMAVYSFLEEYDFSGKTVIPFASSAGSGFSGTIGTLQEMLPGATVIENGLHVPMREVAGAQSTVTSWISELNLQF